MRFVTVFPARLALFLTLLLALPRLASAQNEIRARASNISIGGRLHTQYSHSSIPDATDDVFFRRARVTVDIVINDFLDGKIEPDFAGGRAQLQDTFFRLTFAPTARLSFGIFKRAFSIWDISSSTDLPTIERNAAIEGADLCAGVGGICSLSQLTQGLQLDGRDLGVRLEGTAGRLVYLATITNGTGNNVPDENDKKSFSGRLGFRITDRILLAAFAAAHDALVEIPGTPDENEYFPAFGGDLEIGTWREGFHLLAGVVTGENWEQVGRQLPGGLRLAEAPSFLTAQMLASWYQPLSGSRFAGIEPHLRLGYGDGDRSVSRDEGLLFTPGLMLYVSGRNGIGADLDYYKPDLGDTEYSFKIQTFLYF
jgi:hypothetical protein